MYPYQNTIFDFDGVKSDDIVAPKYWDSKGAVMYCKVSNISLNESAVYCRPYKGFS